jgi:glutamate/aspartate transport system substrate-binding protein
MTMRSLGLLMVFLLLAGTAAARAQDIDSVAKKLQATHTLTIGYRDTSVPLSYLGPDNKPTGYTVELCQDIGEAAKRDLNLPEIKFAYVPVTIQTRQALIANGTVDIVCDGTVVTWARMKQVDFTPIHWVSAEQLLVLKDSGIHDLRDLNGKVVMVATGGTSEPTIQRLIKDEHLDIRVLHVADHPAALVALESHRGDAYLSDNAAFYSLIQSSHHPEDLAVVGPEQPDLRLDRRSPDVRHVQVGGSREACREMVRPVPHGRRPEIAGRVGHVLFPGVAVR